MPSPVPGPVGLPATGGSAPVFVDESGRRHRFVRAFGWLLGGVIAVYLGLLAVSLVGSPGLVPLSLPAIGHVLPGPAAPLLSDGSPAGRSAGELVPTAATPAARTPASAATTVVAAARPTMASRSRARTSFAAKPTGTAAPSQKATPAATPTPAPTSQGNGTPAAHPSHAPKTHPTPHSTHGTGTTSSTAASPSAVATATP